MKILNELQLAKELIRFPTVTPVDAGVMKFLGKKLNLQLRIVKLIIENLFFLCFRDIIFLLKYDYCEKG